MVKKLYKGSFFKHFMIIYDPREEGKVWHKLEVGKKVFEGEMKEAKALYANPAKAYEEKLDKDKQDGTLNIMMDGLMLPTNTID